jgi:hypothetical protein
MSNLALLNREVMSTVETGRGVENATALKDEIVHG